MKLGLLSDAHGNIVGLDNCLRVLDREKVEKLIFIGDAIGYLPMAGEVLKRLSKTGATCLSGNHEAMLSGSLPLDPERDKVYGLDKTRSELPGEMIEQIKRWPSKTESTVDGQRLLFVHGSPWEELTGYIYPDSDLSGFSTLEADVVFMGHTHRPFIEKVGETQVVNIGSCGQPRDHGCISSCAVYDTAQRVSKYLEARLYELEDRHQCIGDARGIGHFWALEIVKNRKTKELFNTKADKFRKALMTDKIAAEALKQGLYIVSWYDTLIVAPPLITTEEQIDEGIETLDKVLEIADQEVVQTDTPGSRSADAFNKVTQSVR